MEANDIETCADEIDKAIKIWRQGINTPFMTAGIVLNGLKKIVTSPDCPRGDADILIDYAIAQVEAMALSPGVLDRALLDWFLRELGLLADEREFDLDLELLVIHLDSLLSEGDHAARGELTALCSNGRRSKPRMFSSVDRNNRILDLAHRYHVVDALAEATNGRNDPGQLAGAEFNRRGYLHGLDLLAHLAQDPRGDISAAARAALIDLCDWPRFAGDAAVRLPIHRLTRDELSRLVDIVEQRTDLFEGRDAVMVPLSHETLQETIVIKTVVFQAMDATRLA